MPNAKTIETVATNFKKLKPSQKNYVLGVMQGFLLAREHPNRANIPKNETAS